MRLALDQIIILPTGDYFPYFLGGVTLKYIFRSYVG